MSEVLIVLYVILSVATLGFGLYCAFQDDTLSGRKLGAWIALTFFLSPLWWAALVVVVVLLLVYQALGIDDKEGESTPWGEAKRMYPIDRAHHDRLTQRRQEIAQTAFVEGAEWSKKVDAERDALRGRLAAIEAALSNHPSTCDIYPEDDPITCGWKRALRDVEAVLKADA